VNGTVHWPEWKTPVSIRCSCGETFGPPRDGYLALSAWWAHVVADCDAARAKEGL
jgi:hypothetical protein